MNLTLKYVISFTLILFASLISPPGNRYLLSDHRLALRSSVPSAEKITNAEQLVVAGYLSRKYRKPFSDALGIVKTAYLEGSRVGLSPLLILAIVEKESSFNVNAKSFYGAIGLMQVVPRFHRDKMKHLGNDEDLHHPVANIQVGTQILASYMKSKNGNLDKALEKYSGKARGYSEKVAQLRQGLDKAVKQGKTPDRFNDRILVASN